MSNRRLANRTLPNWQPITITRVHKNCAPMTRRTLLHFWAVRHFALLGLAECVVTVIVLTSLSN